MHRRMQRWWNVAHVYLLRTTRVLFEGQALSSTSMYTIKAFPSLSLSLTLSSWEQYQPFENVLQGTRASEPELAQKQQADISGWRIR